MLLLHRLETRRKQKLLFEQHLQLLEQLRFDHDKNILLQRAQRRHVIDSVGEHFIVPNWIVSEVELNFRRKGDFQRTGLTLITHCSLSRFHYILQLQRLFDGPISLAVFALVQHIPLLVELVALIRKCHPYVRHNTTFHLVFPLNSEDVNVTQQFVFSHVTECDQLTSRLEEARFQRQEGHFYGEQKDVLYPNNLLRNVARLNSHTSHILMMDIDLIPSNQLQGNFLNFLYQTLKHSNEFVADWSSSKEEKTVFVLPTYEIAHKNIKKPPRTKRQLLVAIGIGTARPFYAAICRKCQMYTEYEKWQTLPVEGGELSIGYEVQWRDPWEPFYIAPNIPSVPLYDERFRQYGFNRISQVCELHVAGFRFFIFKNAFLLHQGWKVQNGFHTGKDLELERNRLFFRQFKNELKLKYPDSERRCY